MYLAYSLLLTLGLLVLIPHFIYQALAHGKYVDGLRQRLGSLKHLKHLSNSVIWLHCVSVGETQAARPLVKRLRAEFPQHTLLVSTITTTGQNLANQVFGNDVDGIFYFPFDWRWSVRRALRAVNPSVVLIMETELWPNFLLECKRQNIPVALINGRISRQSFRRYKLVRFFLARILRDLTLAVMQSESDAERISALGMSNDKVFTAGNMKFDVGLGGASSTEVVASLQTRFGFDNKRVLILAASTHAPEEKVVLESFEKLRRQFDARLMLAPRKPERFQEVANLIANSGFGWSRRTSPAHASDLISDVILLDTIGELPAVYSFATIVFVGGSIVDRGGHNVLEPASAGTCIVTGHHTHNFQAIVNLLNEAGAIVQLPPLEIRKAADCLAHEIQQLLENPERRAELADLGQQIVNDNQGATDRTLTMLRPLLLNSGQAKSKDASLAVDAL